MSLSTYFSAKRGNAAALAIAAGLSQPFLWQCASGARKVPPDRAADIERATGGQVTAEQLRPDVRWQRVPDATWPHPAGRPCLDVARPLTAEAAA